MTDEILALELKRFIIDVYKRHGVIDQDYVLNMAHIIIRHLNLDDYIKDVVITNLNKKDLGQYVSSKKIIKFDIANTMDLLGSITDLNLSYEGRIIYYYISILEFLAHEIEHANQYKSVDSKELNLENKILTSSLLYKSVRNNFDNYKIAFKNFDEKGLSEFFNKKFEVYSLNYYLAPEERLANYYACSLIFKILKDFPNSRDVIDFKKYVFLKYLLMGYDVSLSPTKLYCEKLGVHLLTEDEYESRDLELGERLRLGLKITEQEKQNLDYLTLQLKNKVYR